MYTTTSKIASQLLLASTSSNVLLGRGSEKAFNAFCGDKQCLPLCRISPNFITHTLSYIQIVGGGRKNCLSWEIENAIMKPVESCFIRGVTKPFHELHRKVFERFRTP